ncbi:MAG: dTDP-4-dehydrorhamnose 3,5-epimerase [Alphaproteobacteria bacterium]|nr:dTDP-4-dehydrorhamnose 3,5-epimerase [Alphaproteobacteria bacterium]
MAPFADVYLITPAKFEDDRGYFSESYKKQTLEEAGLHYNFIQDNHSLSIPKGTLRGLHFQAPPFAQAKLVRVIVGSALDVIVDIRKNSKTYGRSGAIELSGKNRKQVLVPAGFAHGFCTLEENTEVIYKVDAPYSKEHDGGILWNDPDLGIEWPVKSETVTLSEKDKTLPSWEDFKTPFTTPEI